MKIHINETKECWVCGEEKDNITSHHAIAKHLKPIRNIIIPVCKDCHKQINSHDINGMYIYLNKINKSIAQNVNLANIALSELRNIKKATLPINTLNSKEKTKVN